MFRPPLIVLIALAWTACATVVPPPPALPGPLPQCKLVETSARPCQPVVWLDGPAFELQRREQLQRSISALCAGIDAGCLDLDVTP